MGSTVCIDGTNIACVLSRMVDDCTGDCEEAGGEISGREGGREEEG